MRKKLISCEIFVVFAFVKDLMKYSGVLIKTKIKNFVFPKNKKY
jgi:hypothetical protein